MDKDLVSMISDIVQSVAIIMTLWIAIRQMRSTDRNSRANIELTLMTKFDDINKLLLERRGIWKLFDEPYVKGRSGDLYEDLVYITHILFNTFELAFRHYTKYDQIDGEDWKQWQASIDAYLQKRYVVSWWEVARANSAYDDRFTEYIDNRPRLSLPTSTAT